MNSQLLFNLNLTEDSNSQRNSPMLNQEVGQAKPRSRTMYNQEYYQKNKERILEKKKKTRLKKILFSFSQSEDGSGFSTLKFFKSSFFWIDLIACLVLSVVLTWYLIKESAGFYLEGQSGQLWAYIQAGMVEGGAILFSFPRGKGTLLRWSQKSVVVLLCGLSLWSMSGKVIKSTSQDSSKSSSLLSTIADLEAEKNQKEVLQQRLIDRGWLGVARKYEKELNQVRQKLVLARQKTEQVQAPHAIAYSVKILLALRLVIVMMNLISIHRVAEQIGDLFRKKETRVLH